MAEEPALKLPTLVGVNRLRHPVTQHDAHHHRLVRRRGVGPTQTTHRESDEAQDVLGPSRSSLRGPLMSSCITCQGRQGSRLLQKELEGFGEAAFASGSSGSCLHSREHPVRPSCTAPSWRDDRCMTSRMPVAEIPDASVAE